METIHDRIQDIARRVFKQPGLIIQDATSAPDVDGWDSLTHIQFIVDVEKAFAVKFRNAEIARLRNIGDLKQLLAKHGKLAA